jgi:hypothetical protein
MQQLAMRCSALAGRSSPEMKRRIVGPTQQPITSLGVMPMNHRRYWIVWFLFFQQYRSLIHTLTVGLHQSLHSQPF